MNRYRQHAPRLRRILFISSLTTIFLLAQVAAVFPGPPPPGPKPGKGSYHKPARSAPPGKGAHAPGKKQNYKPAAGVAGPPVAKPAHDGPKRQPPAAPGNVGPKAPKGVARKPGHGPGPGLTGKPMPRRVPVFRPSGRRPVPVPHPVARPAHRRPAPPLAYGQLFPDLPLGVAAVMVAGAAFYYAAGSYYRPVPSGYVVTRPPVGAVITALPSGCSVFSSYGLTYYSCGGAYYRGVANGYEVITDPTYSASQTLQAVDEVLVTSKALNVRSGPGKENGVIEVVYSGNRLRVIGTAPGWYYVQLPSGSYGWVMAKFTNDPIQEPEG